jgi:capsular exopolysaccharide synthesis family protein
MELRRFTMLVWRWLWLIILGTVVAAGSAYVTSKRMTPVYSASTMLMISPSKAQVMDTLSYQPMGDRLAATYTQMLTGRPVLEAVIGNLALPTTVEALAKNVSVETIRNTQLIGVTAKDTNPERAAAIANEIPGVFIAQNAQLQTGRYAESKASLQRQIDETQANITALEDRIKATQAAQTPDQGALDRDRRDLQALQSGYASLSSSFEDLRLEEAKQLDTLLVTEEARPPEKPIRPKTAQNTLLAAVVGMMLALGVAFLIEYLDDVLKNPDQVKAALGLSVLGAVPVVAGGSADKPAMLAGDQSAVTEAYRVLRTNLQFAAVGRALHLLQVTSASPTEGKSVTSVNLAVALAQGGKQVILVDCDLHRPRVHKLMALPNNLGLTSALIDEACDPLVVLRETSVPRLQVVTSGPMPPNPAEILGSARMHEVLAVLGAAAEIVVLDSPPVLAMSDAAVLAAQVDGVLLVLDAMTTRREPARRALASLQQVQARVVGAVLNRVSRERSGYYYYYYSHYSEPGNGSRRGGRRWPWQKGEGRRRKSEPAASTAPAMPRE